LSNRTPRIAIVDDDKAVCQAIQGFVRSLGYDAFTFASAEDFLKSENIRGTSCLITDLQLPGLSGVDLQDRLIAAGYRIPTILITGHPSNSARARAMKAGAICFLAKPFKHNDLLAGLETALKAV